MAIRDNNSNTETYVGLVVSKREINGYDDSDFMATVWDEATNTFKEVMWATTRFSTNHMDCRVDADEALMKKYKIFLQEEALLEAYNNLCQPHIGAKVCVVKGRKYAGKTGTITWMGPSKFNRHETSCRIKQDDGTFIYVPDTYCEPMVKVPAPVVFFNH